MAQKTKSPRLNRREFTTIVMSFLGSIMGAAVGLPIIGYLISPAVKVNKSESWISLGPLEKYPIGKPVLFNFTKTKVTGWERITNSYGAYVIRQDDTNISVYSNICTHLSCRVTWHEDKQQFICPCHDGRFKTDGTVVSGPPPRPLDQYEYKIEDGNILIHVES